MSCEIELEKLTKGEVRMLSGHERGLSAREYFQIEKLEQSCAKIIILADPKLDAITPSFVQGFWGGSERLAQGRENFLSLYEFKTSDLIKDDFVAGLDRLLMKRTLAGSLIMFNFKEYFKQRKTFRELNSLTDKELRDIGIQRNDIYRISKSGC